MEVYIVKSHNEYNRHFIFRDDGDEVSFRIKNNLIIPDKNLTAEEMAVIRKDILQLGDKRFR